MEDRGFTPLSGGDKEDFAEILDDVVNNRPLQAKLRIEGVSRTPDSRALLVAFNREPTDHEIRRFHKQIRALDLEIGFTEIPDTEVGL